MVSSEPELSVFVGHDASLCVIPPRDCLEPTIVELERIANVRYYKLSEAPDGLEVLRSVKRQLQEAGLPVRFKRARGQTDEQTRAWLTEVFGVEEYIRHCHHEAHAATGLFLSPFSRAWIVSYDGGGRTVDNQRITFRIYLGDKENRAEPIRVYGDYELNLGTAYLILASAINEIRRPEPWNWVFANGLAGKLMGLAAYGTVKTEWLEPLAEFYQEYAGYRYPSPHLAKLGEKLDLDLSPGGLKGKCALDFAATAQRAFELLVLGIIEELLAEKRLPVVMTGGCALNVQVNQRLRDRGVEVFVPPCPNDSGLSLGFALSQYRPEEAPEVTFAGLKLSDLEGWSPAGDFEKVRDATALAARVAGALALEQRIIGVARGGAEVGPRALGNRSILAHVSKPSLKQLINAQIKFREPFRPVAAVVRVEDAVRYFEMESGQENRWMSYAPLVRTEFREALREITHADGTCRIQTVTKAQTPFLYAVLTATESLGRIPVLLNTSFNTKGHPILNTASEACEILRTTPLDGIVIEDWVRFK